MFDNTKFLRQRGVVQATCVWCTVEKLVVWGCELLVCGQCPSSSLLCLHLLMLWWAMWSHVKSYALLVCFPQGTEVFGLVISWLCVCSSLLEALVISPSSSSPLFPYKSHWQNSERKSWNKTSQTENGSTFKACASFAFLSRCIQSLSYWSWNFLGQEHHTQPCLYRRDSVSTFNKYP